MKIVFYNETILSGGIEKCIEMLSKYLKQDYEIEIVYLDESKLDSKIVEILGKYAKIHKLKENDYIEADICIWCRLYFDYDKLRKIIKANKNILWVHSKPRQLENCILDNENFMQEVSKIVCVSETVKKEVNIDEKTVVIHNFIDDNIQELANMGNPFENMDSNYLKLTIVSRLSEGKGFERVLELVKTLKNNKIKFILKVVGKGRAKEQEIKKWFEDYKEVEFVGYRENPYPFVKNADYLLVLSDYESWGNVISEAKLLGTPCVVTNFLSAKEQLTDGIDGIIIPFEDEKNYYKYIQKMQKDKEILSNNLRDFKYNNEIEKWNEILS